MERKKIQYERDGIIFNAICLNYDEVDEFINQNPAYRPIDYDSSYEEVYVSDEVNKYRTYKVFRTCPICWTEHYTLVIVMVFACFAQKHTPKISQHLPIHP